MFNVFKAKKNETANNPLSSLSDDIEKAKARKVNEKQENETNEVLFAESFKIAVDTLQQLLSENGYSKEKFDLCLQNLLKATELKSTEPSPYYYLSLILSIVGKKEEAMEYFDIVNYIDPEFDGLDLLYQQIQNLESEESDEPEFDPLPQVEADALDSILGNLSFAKN
ncbi:MAG: hypothetical protein H7263_10945 [Candidatus Sericytochromatia bacterium]|nr:hypothetical protein [Candidatus Sericytochromatia bacterium]